jgi:hypothetical protein
MYFYLKKLILRGLLLRWWTGRRTRQVDAAYLAALTTALEHRDNVVSPRAPAIARPARSLERVLFIGDCMWEQDQIFPELRKICQLDVLDLRPALNACAESRSAVVEAIRKHAAASRTRDPDVILFYARPALLSEEAFSAIRENWNCPLLGMNLDDRVEFFQYNIFKNGNDNYGKWIGFFDLNLTSSVTAMDWYHDNGANVYYFPQGFHQAAGHLQPPNHAHYQHRLSFVGSWKAERGRLMEQLAAHGIQPTLFGRGWQDSQWVDNAATVFRNSQINLGIGYALASARIANAKGRDIECAGVGACYLTTYHWELPEIFEIGKEVLCYRNMEELVEIYSYYSKRPDACLKIAQAAHRRAMQEHTWETRFRNLFKELGFKGARL